MRPVALPLSWSMVCAAPVATAPTSASAASASADGASAAVMTCRSSATTAGSMSRRRVKRLRQAGTEARMAERKLTQRGVGGRGLRVGANCLGELGHPDRRFMSTRKEQLVPGDPLVTHSFALATGGGGRLLSTRVRQGQSGAYGQPRAGHCGRMLGWHGLALPGFRGGSSLAAPTRSPGPLLGTTGVTW